MKKPLYQIYIRNDWPLPFVEPWAFGPTNLAKSPFRWQLILVANLGDKYAWGYYANNVTKIGHSVDSYLTNKKNLKAFKNQAKQAELENRNFAAKISKTNLAKLSVKELSGLLRQWYNAHNRFTTRFMPIDATDETLEADIQTAVQKAGLNIPMRDLTALLTPNTLSYIQKEHKEFCTLAKRVEKNFNSSLTKKAISLHADKWWWTVMGWGQHRPLNEKTIKNKLDKIKNLRELLLAQKRDEQARNLIIKQKRILIGKLPKSVKSLLNAFEVLAAMHDTRKEIQMKMMSAGFLLTRHLLKKINIPLHFRNFILVEEYLNLQNGQIPTIIELKNRKKAYWCEFSSGGKIVMLSGKNALAKIKQSGIDHFAEIDKSGTVKGFTASPGTAKGRVRVGLKAQDVIRKIKPGEILITSQTTPEFAPAMKKAAAIITDEGGITSHAAIVSRELGIPCIIGTKIATKVFKDGDMVEVDANIGIIKKL